MRRRRRKRLNRLDLTIGSAIILVLVAALVGPWLVDWTAYRDTFENEASKILGHPVRVEGSASARLLPMPTLTFTDVSVGEPDAEPMMTVKRFSLKVELLPLLKGVFLVNDLVLERPVLHLTADNGGKINWLTQGGSAVVNPERVVIQRLEVRRGAIDFRDVRTGASVVLTDINTNKVDARSLYGPWRIDGSLKANGVRTSFTVATGRATASGALAMSAEIVPAELVFAGRLLTDGMVRLSDAGVTYAGKYRYEKMEASGPSTSGMRVAPVVVSFRSDGKFDLTPQRLRIADFALARGGGGDLSDVTGAVTVGFGSRPRFDAVVSARQINLDAQAGKGPEGRASVANAARDFAAFVSGLPVSPMPGRIGIDIPAVVVGGSLIQNLRLDAVAKDATWSIEGLSVELPGRTTVTADGLITPGSQYGLVADVHVASELPAALASWWQGNGDARPIVAFDFGAGIRLSADAVDAENIVVRMGGATARGAAHWARSGTGGQRSSVDLAADRLDLVSLLGVAELVGGGRVPAITDLPEEFVVRVTADKVTARQTVLEQVAIDLSREADRLIVNRLSVGNLAGARLETQSGRIAGIDGNPHGRLETVLTAENLDGLSQLAGTIAPDSGLARWLRRAAPDLAPVELKATLAAPGDGASDYTLSLSGHLGSTDVASRFSLAGKLAHWREGVVSAMAEFTSADAASLGRQAGLDLMPIAQSGTGKFTARIEGVPNEGAETNLAGELAGLSFSIKGKTTVPAAAGARFEGRIESQSQNLESLLLLFGRPPALEAAGDFAMAGTLTTSGTQATIGFETASVGGRAFGGRLLLSPEASGWKIGGRLDVDTLDLAWLGALSLGMEPLPAADSGRTWPEIPFVRPAFGAFNGVVEVSAGRVAVGRMFDVANAKIELTVHPDLLGIDLRSGSVAGGAMVGEIQVRNPSGDAAVTGHFAIKGSSLGELVWRSEDRPVANGRFDARANFEATGRSVAALVGSLAGDGTFAIHDGELRYVNLAAFETILQASELGRAFTGNELRDLFRSYFDLSTLSFREAGGTFKVAAGKMRATNIRLETIDAGSSGDATIDLNTLAIESGWMIAMAKKDELISGAAPQVEVVFIGPLAAPERRINVSQFAEYLTLKTLQREQVLHDALVAERRERELARELAAERRAAGAAMALRAAQEEAARWTALGAAARKVAEEEAARKAAEAEAVRAAQERLKAEAEGRSTGSPPGGAPLDLHP